MPVTTLAACINYSSVSRPLFMMTTSRKVNLEKAAKYVVAASKGFSYYLPKSAQVHLKELLKELPSAARPIYDEYYRDLMCAKACAPESAVALAHFVTKTFPVIAHKRNAFAIKMNEEIDDNEHEGYLPVKFPVVDVPDVEAENNAITRSMGGKRKRAPTRAVSKTEMKFKPSTQLAKMLPTDANTSSLSSSPFRRPDRGNTESIVAGNAATTANRVPTDDVAPPTPTSHRFTENERDRSGKPLDRLSRSSHSLSDARFRSNRIEIEATNELPMLNRDEEQQRSELKLLNTDLMDIEQAQTGSSVVSLPEDHAPEVLERSSIILEAFRDQMEEDRHADSQSEYVYDSLTEEQRWEDGMNVIESFQWTGKVSCRRSSQDLTSIHDELKLEKSAGVFRGNYWDNAGAEGSLFELGQNQKSFSTSPHR